MVVQAVLVCLAAVTKYFVSGLSTTEMYFIRFCRLEFQD